jgi:hypothetical protein
MFQSFQVMSPPNLMRIFSFSLLCLLALIGASLRAQEIPDELLEDEHFREEFGVNQFTTPSIRKIFDDLKKLRPLPYEELKRKIPEEVPQDRTKLAVSVGLLLADGFFAVEAEQFFDLEPVGRSLLKNAKALGSGTRVSSHMKSMLEKGALADWDNLKVELAKAQSDVEKEMVLIRDVDAANLVSLGGWLRAFEIGCAASLGGYYSVEKAAILGRPEVVEYFVANLETLEPRLQEADMVIRIRADLMKIQERLALPEGTVLDEAGITELQTIVEGLVDLTYGPKLLDIPAPTPGEGASPAAPATEPAAPADQPAAPPASSAPISPSAPVVPGSGRVAPSQAP